MAMPSARALTARMSTGTISAMVSFCLISSRSPKLEGWSSCVVELST